MNEINDFEVGEKVLVSSLAKHFSTTRYYNGVAIASVGWAPEMQNFVGQISTIKTIHQASIEFGKVYKLEENNYDWNALMLEKINQSPIKEIPEEVIDLF